MNRFKKHMVVAALAALVVVVGTLINSQPAVAQNPIPVGPVSVRDVDNAARQPFQIHLCSSSSSGICDPFEQSYSVPADRRLVIEYVSGECQLSNVEHFAVNVESTAGANQVGADGLERELRA